MHPVSGTFAMRAMLLPLVLAAAAVARGQPNWQEGFEGPEPSWKDAGGDVQHQTDVHDRVREGAHSGQWCERIRVSGNNGSTVYFSYEVGSARVIAELQPSVWIKSDRAGLQVLARVVLPRSVDPRSGKPVTTLLSGAGYTHVGSWQQLRVDNIPQLLDKQLRVLRAQLGPQVDSHEAFVDRIVLNVYGGPGATTVWIDDLEVPGFVGRSGDVAAEPGLSNPDLSDAGPVTRLPPTSDGAISSQAAGGAQPDVRLNAGVLEVAGRPFFPRIIEHRGEPLARLQSLGFNAVRVSATPTDELLAEARRLRLWLIAPPPPHRELEALKDQGAGGRLGEKWAPVMAWHLGEGPSSRELEANRRWAKLLRAADPRGRPILGDVEAELRAYSRHLDILLVHRFPLAGSLEIADYSAWLRQRLQLARPGTPIWTTVQTQPTEQLAEQWALLSGGRVPRVDFTVDQVRLVAYSALAAGARALCFQSQTPLDGTDPQSRLRAATLELLNLELGLLEPWAAGGAFVTTASSNDPQLAGAVMQTERARLLLPLLTTPHSQLATGAATAKTVSFVIPGVPESNDAHELTTAGLRPLQHKRVAGGMRVAFEEDAPATLVLLTQDPLVTSSLSQRTAKIRRRAAELEREIAALELAADEQLDGALVAQGHSLPQGQPGLASTRAGLSQCDRLLTAGDYQNALVQARRVTQGLRRFERAHWEQATKPLVSPLASPLALSFGSLHEHWRFVNVLATTRRGGNRLTAGDFESLQAMTEAGWRHFEHPQPGITTSVDLSPEGPHSGRLSLRLKAVVAPEVKSVGSVETPPVWITSAPVALQQGQWVQIHGWAKAPKAIQGSVDGLVIIDSLAGEALAERVGVTKGWREFNLVRAAPRSGPMTLTFALSGVGEAWIDDVTIEPIERAVDGRFDQAGHTQPAARAP